MRKWIAQKFHKGDYIVINIIKANKSVKTYYEIPEGNRIKVKDQTFTLNENLIIYKKNEPNLFYNEECITPINFFPTENDISYFGDLTPNKLKAGMENNLINQLFSTFGKNDKLEIGVLLNIFTLLLILGIAVYMYVSFGNLTEILNKVNETISQFWG